MSKTFYTQWHRRKPDYVNEVQSMFWHTYNPNIYRDEYFLKKQNNWIDY